MYLHVLYVRLVSVLINQRYSPATNLKLLLTSSCPSAVACLSLFHGHSTQWPTIWPTLYFCLGTSFQDKATPPPLISLLLLSTYPVWGVQVHVYRRVCAHVCVYDGHVWVWGWTYVWVCVHVWHYIMKFPSDWGQNGSLGVRYCTINWSKMFVRGYKCSPGVQVLQVYEQ